MPWACFAISACLLHILFDGRYGYFRDELYYAACGQHLAWGYVDQAPLIAVVARFSRALFGDSLHALRFFPALAAGVMILLPDGSSGTRRKPLRAVTCGYGGAGMSRFLTMDSFLSMNVSSRCFGCCAPPFPCASFGLKTRACGRCSGL